MSEDERPKEPSVRQEIREARREASGLLTRAKSEVKQLLTQARAEIDEVKREAAEEIREAREDLRKGRTELAQELAQTRARAKQQLLGDESDQASSTRPAPSQSGLPCARCGGTGKDTDHWPDDMGKPCPPCGFCGGTGRQTVTS